VYLPFNFLRHGQRRPLRTVNASTSIEAEKVIAALLVTSGSECNRPDSPRTHGIVVFLVSLDALPKLNSAM